MLILKFKPRINKRDELETIKRFLQVLFIFQYRGHLSHTHTSASHPTHLPQSDHIQLPRFSLLIGQAIPAILLHTGFIPTVCTLHIIYLFTVVGFHVYIILCTQYIQSCSIFSLVVVLSLYVIDYKILSSYELTFVMNFCYVYFLIKLIELKVTNFALDLCFLRFEFLIEIFLEHE